MFMGKYKADVLRRGEKYWLDTAENIPSGVSAGWTRTEEAAKHGGQQYIIF